MENYTEEQLKKLIGEVEKEFTTHLSKAAESFKLSKSESPPKKEKPKKDESKEKDEAKASSESSGEEKKPMEQEKPEDKGAKDQDQQKAGEAPLPKEGEPSEPQAGDESHGYDDEDMQHMHAMYSSMSKPELKAHHDAVRKCMDSHGLAKCEDGMTKSETGDAAKDAEGYRPNGGPKDGEAAKAKTPASSDAQALNKSEKDVVVISDEVKLLKSELEAAK